MKNKTFEVEFSPKNRDYPTFEVEVKAYDRSEAKELAKEKLVREGLEALVFGPLEGDRQ